MPIGHVMDVSAVGANGTAEAAAMAALAATMRTARENGQALLQLIAQPTPSPSGTGRLIDVRA